MGSEATEAEREEYKRDIGKFKEYLYALSYKDLCAVQRKYSYDETRQVSDQERECMALDILLTILEA